jgi:adenine deaminase
MSYGHLLETQAAQAVSLNAANTAGMHDRGKLMPRLRADIAVFERGTNRPLMTIRKGKIVFNSGDNYVVEEGNV